MVAVPVEAATEAAVVIAVEIVAETEAAVDKVVLEALHLVVATTKAVVDVVPVSQKSRTLTRCEFIKIALQWHTANMT